jgi:hypothetical protein
MIWSALNELSRRMNFSIHSLKWLQYFLPYKTKIALAHALLLPILDMFVISVTLFLPKYSVIFITAYVGKRVH